MRTLAYVGIRYYLFIDKTLYVNGTHDIVLKKHRIRILRNYTRLDGFNDANISELNFYGFLYVSKQFILKLSTLAFKKLN